MRKTIRGISISPGKPGSAQSYWYFIYTAMNKQEMENGANRARFSGENLLNHSPMNVGQPALDAVVIKIQALVIETQQV